MNKFLCFLHSFLVKRGTNEDFSVSHAKSRLSDYEEVFMRSIGFIGHLRALGL
jgi:hypothetical protein